MRKKIIAGNWKMNLNHQEAAALASGLVETLGDMQEVDVVLCPTFTSLQAVREVIADTRISLGAQNMFWEPAGAFTGEISADMLLTLGCEYVILGHSERRTYFGDTDENVARKVRAAIDAGLTPIVCVGETREEREDGVTEEVVERQVRRAFGELTPDQFKGCVVAYEPVWAIGTGLTATPEQAQEVHAFIRGILAKVFDLGLAGSTRIQYGGSMKPDNARELLLQPDIDGGLIGGASLKTGPFTAIVKAPL